MLFFLIDIDVVNYNNDTSPTRNNNNNNNNNNSDNHHHDPLHPQYNHNHNHHYIIDIIMITWYRFVIYYNSLLTSMFKVKQIQNSIPIYYI